MMRLNTCIEERASFDHLLSDSEASLWQAREAAALDTALMELNRSLASARTTAEVAETIVHEAFPRMGAQSGALVLVARGGMRLELAKSNGLPQELAELLRSFSLVAPLPLADAIRTDKPLWFGSSEALAARYPQLERIPAPEGPSAVAVVPLTEGGEPLGAMTLHFKNQHTFEQDERARILQFAELCAQALGRVRAKESAVEAASLLRAEVRRRELLIQATGLLDASPQYEATLTAVGQLGVPVFADWCALDIREDSGGFRRVAVTTKDNTKIGLARELQHYHPPDFCALRGTARVLQTGSPELVSTMNDALRADECVEPGQIDAFKELGCTSYIIVPLVARERLFVAMTFVSTDPT